MKDKLITGIPINREAKEEVLNEILSKSLTANIRFSILHGTCKKK